MKIYTHQSLKSNPKDAVAELKENFNHNNIKAITFFASSNYNNEELISAMNDTFPNIQVWGVTTCGEIISNNITTDSIVAMAFTDEIIEDIKIEVVDNNNINLMENIASFEKYYSTSITKLNSSKYFFLTYFNGLSKKEEVILDELGEYSNLFIGGGSAADNLVYQKAKTYANGKFYDNATIIALIKSKSRFGFEKMQSFVPTEHKVIATKVDEASRTIFELNGKPAGTYFCEIVNVPNEKLQETFSSYALGYIIDGQPFLRALQFRGDNSILGTGCAIKEGMELVIMKSINLIEDTKQHLEEVKKKYNTISALLTFDCGYRFYELTQSNSIPEYTKLFNDLPVIGFYTYGETYLGHLNQTLVMLVFE
jgi:hypothetical protein